MKPFPWIRLFENDQYAKKAIRAIEEGVESGKISEQDAVYLGNKPQMILNLPIQLPESLKTHVYFKLEKSVYQTIVKRLDDLIRAGLQQGKLLNAIDRITEKHHGLSPEACIDRIVLNPYMLGQALTCEEMLLVDKLYHNNPNLEQQRVAGFLNAACEQLWRGTGRPYLKVRENSRLIRIASDFLSRHGDQTKADYTAYIMQNWTRIFSGSKNNIAWSYGLETSEYNNRKTVFPAWVKYDEKRAANAIAEYLIRPLIKTPIGWEVFLHTETINGIRMDASQREALTKIWQQPMTVLTGGPGSGKSTLMLFLKRALEKFSNSYQIDGMSPTGAGAKRLETVSNICSKTIHRAFGMYSEHKSIEKGSYEMPDVDDAFLLVDETGMANIAVFHAVLWGAPKNMNRFRLVLIGDKDQLGPIGFGAPFSTLIHHPRIKDFTVELTQNHRSNDDIGNLARSVWDKTINWSWGDKLKSISASDKEVVFEHIREWVEEHGGIESDDWQILCPYIGENDSHEFGYQEINNLFLSSDNFFEVGNRIVQKTNNYRTERINGEIGRVIKNENNLVTCSFQHGTPTTLPILDAYEEWVPAYAMTVHRAQGGEWKHVLFVYPIGSGRFYYDRHLFYTGCTRAKESLTILTENPEAFVQAVADQEGEPKKTSLGSKITWALDNAGFKGKSVGSKEVVQMNASVNFEDLFDEVAATSET